MTDSVFAVIWILSFFLYFTIYTLWIPLKTQKKIEDWLRSEASDETLLLSLEVIVKRIREQMLHDFEEFMMPRAKEGFKDFWNGAMGNAAKQLSKSEEGSEISILHNMTKDLSGQPWYVQAAASKLLPIITNATKNSTKTNKPREKMGLGP